MRAVLVTLWSGLCAAGCYSPEPPLGAPCTANGECPAGQECDLLTNICGYPTETRTLRDDTAAQFEGGTLDGATIEANGFVGPIPYLIGGVRLTSLDGDLVADAANVTFEDLAAMTPLAHGVVRSLDIDFGDGIPPLLGFTVGDAIAVLVEGEIYLDTVGTYTIELRANDNGFIDIAPPGSTTFTRVTEATNTAVTAPYAVTTPGWHRIRGAFSDQNQFFQYEVRYRPPSGGFRSVPRDTIRSHVDGLDGAMVDAFVEAYMSSPAGSGLTNKLDGLMFMSDPYGFSTGGVYTLRWSGQMRIDTEGDYQFKIDTSHGHRAWIDTMEVARNWDGAPHVTTTQAMHLVPGWHSFVVDAVKAGGTTGRFSFTIESGPVTGPIPADHLRPSPGRTARFATQANGTVTAITDGMTITRSVFLDLPSTYTAVMIDTLIQLTHPMQAQLSMVLDPPSGANLTLLAAATLTGVDEYTQHDVLPLDRAGTSYNFIAGDSLVDTIVGSVTYVAASMVYTGGRPAYAPTATYTSTVRELNAVRMGAMTWSMRQLVTAPTVSVRTCAEIEACDAEAWTPVAEGETPSVEARKYFQYKIEIATSEDIPTALDWIQLDYVGTVEP